MTIFLWNGPRMAGPSIVVNDDWSIPASSSTRSSFLTGSSSSTRSSSFLTGSTYRSDLPNLVITGVSVTQPGDRLEVEGEGVRGSPGGRWRVEEVDYQGDRDHLVDQVVPELRVPTNFTMVNKFLTNRVDEVD